MAATMPHEPTKKVVPIHKSAQKVGPTVPKVRYPTVTDKAQPAK